MGHRLERWSRESKMLAWRAYLAGRYHLTSEKRRPDQVLLVLSTYRTGSTLLIDYLNGLPGARFFGELMHTGQCRGPKSGMRKDLLPFLRGLFNGHSLTGFKIQLDQLEASDVTLTDLKSLSRDTRFLLLYRRSLFRQFVSHKHALQTDVWELTPPRTPLKIDETELLAYCDGIRRRYEGARKRLAGERCWALAYEDLCRAGPVGFSEGLHAFAGTEPFHPVSRLIKQSRDLRGEISNYLEVERWIDHPRTKLEIGE